MTRRQRRPSEGQRAQSSAWARRRLTTVAGLAVGVALALTANAQAATTYTVNNVTDANDGSCTASVCSLRDALTQAEMPANSGSTIKFTTGLGGTIPLTSTLPTITQPTTIAGPGSVAITVSGSNSHQILSVGASPASLTLSGLTLSSGKNVAGNGGAIGSSGGNVSVTSAVVSSSSALNGGGIAASGGTLTITGSTLSGDTAPTGDGGAVYANGGSVSVVNSTLSGGGAINGAGMETTGLPTTQVTGSTVSGNTATNNGGGLDLGGSGTGTSTVQNSTITGNKATVGGGGIEQSSTNQSLTLDDSTVASNSATAHGGGIDASQSAVTLNDTIVSGDSAGSGPDLAAASGATFAGAFDLIKNTSGATVTETVAGSNITGQDAQLAALASNGGPTQTMKPQLTSPVIDKGKSFGLATDQRGLTRPFDNPAYPNSAAAGADGSDIGAVELQSSEFPHVLHVTITGSGRGKVTAPGFSCGSGTCSQTVPGETVVDLRASPANGSQFVGWSGACSGRAVCALFMTEDMSVTAKFKLLTPGIKIKKAKINAKHHKAKFKFKGVGVVTGFECRLYRQKAKHKPAYKKCKSPKTYTNLSAGKYVFQVRSVNSVGVSKSPAKRKFTIP